MPSLRLCHPPNWTSAVLIVHLPLRTEKVTVLSHLVTAHYINPPVKLDSFWKAAVVNQLGLSKTVTYCRANDAIMTQLELASSYLPGQIRVH